MTIKENTSLDSAVDDGQGSRIANTYMKYEGLIINHPNGVYVERHSPENLAGNLLD